MPMLSKVIGVIFVLSSFLSSAQAQTGSGLSCPYHGKALFKYPTEHPVSIVTYTQQDLEILKEQRFLRSLKHATYTVKKPSRLPASTRVFE